MSEETKETSAPAESTTQTSAPSSPPAPAPQAQAESAVATGADDADADVDWAAMAAPEDDGASSKPAAPAAAAPAATQKVAQPAPEPPKAAAAQPAVEPPKPAATPAPEPAKPVAPQKTAEQIEAEQKAASAAIEAEEKKLYDQLVSYYKLPDEVAVQLQTEPENVLPQLAAKLHQSIAKSVYNLIQTYLPQAIRQVNEYESREASARKAFYERWPQLVGKEAQVLEVGALFRRLNPNATPEEAIEKIGRAVHEALGIALPAAPAAPPPPKAFTPAGGGAMRGGAPAADNPFTQLAEEMLREDAG